MGEGGDGGRGRGAARGCPAGAGGAAPSRRSGPVQGATQVLHGLGERTLKCPLSLFFARACPFSGTGGAGREPSGSRGIELTTRAGLTCLLSHGGMRCYII